MTVFEKKKKKNKMESSVYYTKAKTWEKILQYLIPSSLNYGPIIEDYVQWGGMVEGLLTFISPGVSIYWYAISI